MMELCIEGHLIQVYVQERALLEGARKGIGVQYKPV